MQENWGWGEFRFFLGKIGEKKEIGEKGGVAAA
jgi:hypothetical protein